MFLKKICVLLLVLGLIPYTTLRTQALDVSTTEQEQYPDLTKKIDAIFVVIDKELEKKDIDTQAYFYTTLISRVQKLENSGKKYSAKDTFILTYISQKTHEALNNLEDDEVHISDIFGENIVEETEGDTIKGDIDDIGSEYQDYTFSSEETTQEIARFTLEKDTTIQYIKLAIIGEDKVEFYKGRNKVKIVGAETDYNISTSTSVEFGGDDVAYVYFKSPIYIKAGNYKFTTQLTAHTSTNYGVYIRSLKVRDKQSYFENDGKKISDVTIKHVDDVKNEAGIEAQNITVKELQGVIGKFEVYGDEFFFKKLELEIDMNQTSSFQDEIIYLLDKQGQIISTNSGYREESDEIIYATFRNIILKEGDYKVSVKEIQSESPISTIEIWIGDYILETEHAIFKDGYFKGNSLSKLEVLR